ncbi:unnamed protein product [Gadus morhua 'NCC']
MDIAVVNSFLLQKELYKIRNDPTMRKPRSQKTFREQLAAEMLVFAEGSVPPPPPTCMPMYYGADGTQSRRYCRMCQDAGILRVKTPVYCRKCQEVYDISNGREDHMVGDEGKDGKTNLRVDNLPQSMSRNKLHSLFIMK